MARQHREELSMGYLEAPQGLFSPSNGDLEAFTTYARAAHPDTYHTSLGFEANGAQLYHPDAAAAAAAAAYMYLGESSPGMFADDDMRVPPSDLSTASATSSNMGSPLSSHGQLAPMQDWVQGLCLNPGIVDQPEMFAAGAEYPSLQTGMDGFGSPFDFAGSKPHFVDPSLIHPDVRALAMPQQYENAYPPPNSAYPTSPAMSASPQLRNGSASPFVQNTSYQQYSPFPVPVDTQGRRPSMVSFHSSLGEPVYSGDESREKQSCSDCGKTFKDLKAHMLTHQMERPEKCPIASCEYHTKGFARKYDKNRHTLTHYKGTMVCGFCPGSGSANEKSFNRADVFKRHLTAVHGVEQTAPNSRKKTSSGMSNGKKLTGYAADATGKCSTCSQTFCNAQEFYEHLDDCVLRIVQQEDPAEAINASRLAEVENDRNVHDTLEKNKLPTDTMMSGLEEEDDDEMAGGGGGGDDESLDDESKAAARGGGGGGGGGGAGKMSASTASPINNRSSKGNPANGVQKSRGMTHSRGGRALTGKVRGRKNRRDYPSSWGFDKGQMTMKKRVTAVFDGPRRLAKDDMMLSTEHEVRVPLANGRSYVTDLDVQTLRRTEAFLNATDAEKGPWISDDPTEEDLKKMIERSAEVMVASQ